MAGPRRPRPPSPPIQSTPVDPLIRIAEAHLKARRYEEAIRALLEAARLAPENPTISGNLGSAYLVTRRFPGAITHLRRSIALRPTFARTHHHIGLALQQTGADEEALLAYRRASALQPGFAEAHGRVGDLEWERGRPAEAEEAYERAFAAAPDTTLGRLSRAKARMTQDRPSEAEEQLRDVIARDPASAEAHLVLAHVLNDAGRFDEATTHFERSIAIAPHQATAYKGLVSSRKLTEADRPLVARILERTVARDLGERQQMTLHFAVGKGLDDLKDYAGAIEHFDAANRIRGKLTRFSRGEHERLVDRMIARFTREFFASHPMAGNEAGNETPLLVLGMPRSGTTLIERILSSHPRVGGGGELVFWRQRGLVWADAQIDKLRAEADALRGDYLRVLRGVAGGESALRVTDKMPFNYLWIGLVHLLFPDARILHSRRNPIDTCLSIYSTQFLAPRYWGFACDRGDLAWYYRQYLRLMDHWRAVLPAERFLEVDYEETTAAPEEVARRLIAFAGLEWDPACMSPERNPDAIKTSSKWQARQPIYRSSVERWRNYEPWLGELRGLLP